MAKRLRLRLPLASCLTLARLSAAAAGQELIAIDGFTGEVSKVDLMTAAVSPVGNTGLTQLLWTGLARDGQGKFYASYGYWHTPHVIYELDPNSAQVTFHSQTDLTAVAGIAFDDSNVLYALKARNAPAGGPFDLYIIDLATGQTALIGDTQLTNCGNLAFRDGKLWTYTGDLGLVMIDPSTAQAEDVNDSFRGPVGSTESLCFSEDGILYQLDSGLWIQDVHIGVPSLVGLTQYFGLFDCAEYLPGPAPPFALGTLGQTGGPMGAQVWGATPGGDVVLLAALGPAGVAQIPAGRPCAGTTIDLNATYRAAAVLRADARGHALAGPVHAPAAVAGSLRLQALELTTCTTSNLARVIY